MLAQGPFEPFVVIDTLFFLALGHFWDSTLVVSPGKPPPWVVLASHFPLEIVPN